MNISISILLPVGNIDVSNLWKQVKLHVSGSFIYLLRIIFDMTSVEVVLAGLPKMSVKVVTNIWTFKTFMCMEHQNYFSQSNFFLSFEAFWIIACSPVTIHPGGAPLPHPSTTYLEALLYILEALLYHRNIDFQRPILFRKLHAISPYLIQQ